MNNDTGRRNHVSHDNPNRGYTTRHSTYDSPFNMDFEYGYLSMITNFSTFVSRTQDMYSQIEDRLFLHNAFCFYDRQFVLDHKFDETLPGKEDRYWAQYINKLNLTYLYNPNFEVNHYYTSNGATWKGIG